MIYIDITIRTTMRVEPECVPCVLNRVIFQAKLVQGSCPQNVMDRALQDLDNCYKKSVNASECSSIVHGNSYEEIGDSDPYRELSESAYETVDNMMPFFNVYVQTSREPLRSAFISSSIANILDLGTYNAINSPEAFMDRLMTYIREGLKIDDFGRISAILERSKKVAFLFDNSGEDKVDTILIDEIKKSGCKVTGFLKRRPSLNDTTVDLAREHGVSEHLDKIMEIEGFALGLNEKALTDEMRQELKDCELIISKGMANFEALSDVKEYGPIAFILKAKCEPIARKLNVPLGSSVLYLSE